MITSLINPTFIRNSTAAAKGKTKLKVVTLNYLPSAYKFVTDWIHENGHEHD
jgi:hypothetical protein